VHLLVSEQCMYDLRVNYNLMLKLFFHSLCLTNFNSTLNNSDDDIF